MPVQLVVSGTGLTREGAGGRGSQAPLGFQQNTAVGSGVTPREVHKPTGKYMSGSEFYLVHFCQEDLAQKETRKVLSAFRYVLRT